MENRWKFFLIMIVCVVLAASTLVVYQSKYGSIVLSGFTINQSGNSTLNWSLVALVAQWFMLGLAIVIAGFHYLNPYKTKY